MLTCDIVTCAHLRLSSAAAALLQHPPHSIFVTVGASSGKRALPLDVTKIPSRTSITSMCYYSSTRSPGHTGLQRARRKIGPARLARRTARDAPPNFRSSDKQSCAACTTMRGNGRRPRPPHQVLHQQPFAQNRSRCCPPTCCISHTQRINMSRKSSGGGGASRGRGSSSSWRRLRLHCR